MSSTILSLYYHHMELHNDVTGAYLNLTVVLLLNIPSLISTIASLFKIPRTWNLIVSEFATKTVRHTVGAVFFEQNQPPRQRSSAPDLSKGY